LTRFFFTGISHTMPEVVPDLPIFGARIILNPLRAGSHQRVSIRPIASGLTPPLRVGTTRAPVKSGHFHA
jgi:hypothetical protein